MEEGPQFEILTRHVERRGVRVIGESDETEVPEPLSPETRRPMKPESVSVAEPTLGGQWIRRRWILVPIAIAVSGGLAFALAYWLKY